MRHKDSDEPAKDICIGDGAMARSALSEGVDGDNENDVIDVLVGWFAVSVLVQSKATETDGLIGLLGELR